MTESSEIQQLARADVYRIRLGDLRIVYHVDWVDKIVDIEFLEPRGQAYKDN